MGSPKVPHDINAPHCIVGYEVGMAESPSIATVVSAMLCCDLVSILFGDLTRSGIGDQEREGGREGARGSERILPLDCITVYDLTMYTVHVSIAHWIHYSTVM